MSGPLDALLILQDRDTRLRRIVQELKAIPAEEKTIADRLAAQSRHHEELKLKARQIESQRKDLENQAGSLRDKINKYGQQQLQTKKNEEYQALGHEIDRAKADIAALEDRQLECMEAFEAAQKDVATEGAKVREFEAAAQARRADLTTKKALLEKQQADLEAELKTLEAGPNPADLTRYRRILSSKGDIAIVPVEHGNKCGGCHMSLTHQSVLNAKGNTGLVPCENCGRLLYWKSEFI
ncbi:MAG: C4-type zinc ribbon domain-containing protein [Candidatus Methylacidiphilales bacterium]|nr:C4-type zinc ribbon domain-containing protein [Candidatus Methylacidiphilales bacterium]